MISARTMKNVRENGCPEVNWRRMNAIYASNGPGNTGSNEPMIAIIHKIHQRMISAISMLLQLRIKQLRITNVGICFGMDYSYIAISHPGANGKERWISSTLISNISNYLPFGPQLGRASIDFALLPKRHVSATGD